MVSRTGLLAHAAAFLALGFVAGLGARETVERSAPREPAPAFEPRDEFIVAPATEDSPAMVMWVAAELDAPIDAPRRLTRTLGYVLPETGAAPHATPPAPRPPAQRVPGVWRSAPF